MNENHTPPHFPTTTAPKQHPFSSEVEQRPTMSTEAEMAALSSADIFRIDDLLDFSNEDLFPSSSSTTTTTTTDTNIHFPVFDLSTPNSDTPTTNFPHDFCVPNDDLAELEWLSNFVDDSFSNYPIVNHTIPVAAASTTNNITPVPAKARSKRPKPTLTNHSWTSLAKSDSPSISNYNSFPRIKEENKASSSSSTGGGGRKCTHCASERTPQWRTGPMGPKTLCNACGVRYKSGRLVPEYRPAASPTFMLTRHSNSHRKVLELRRQKEVGVEDCHEFFHHHHDYKIC